ncbi:ABC transporter substrate-binding protein [uncultured Nitratireductor sp.]|uniref:ABC transporter substrate-binding protein n=1 Tax=uncultured Nitratireductor sp. TaxID=520953 RepID=UPI0025E35968|nr:ABC transporter substrate-binding protein [uncultured Nitratireductor sp.]
MSSKKRFLLSTLPVLGMLCGIPAAAETLNVQITADIRSSRPGVNRDALSDSVALNVGEGLVAFGERGQIVPMLAEDWTVSDDGRVYTFTLREDRLFHNGAPLTAEIVKQSWEALMAAPDFTCNIYFNGNRGSAVERIEAPDARTVIFTLAEPDAMFLKNSAQSLCGGMAIMHADSFDGDGNWKGPVGTGPFVFDEWKRGQSIHLTKFAEYVPVGEGIDGYGGRKEVLVDDVNLIVTPDRATAVAALRSGDLDIVPYLSTSEAGELTENPNFQVHAAPHGGMITLLMQTADPVLSSTEMRHAIAKSLNIPELVDVATNGLGEANASLVPIGSVYHGEVQERAIDYAPEEVSALLKAAGYSGQELVIQTNRRNPINENVAVIAQSMLQAQGIRARIEVLEWATQLDRFRNGNFQLSAFNYSNRSDPALAYSAVVASKEDRGSAIWDDPEAIELVEKTFQTPDGEERQALFDALHELYLEQMPFVMLANNLDVSVSASYVQNYRTWNGFTRLWGVSLDR